MHNLQEAVETASGPKQWGLGGVLFANFVFVIHFVSSGGEYTTEVRQLFPFLQH